MGDYSKALARLSNSPAWEAIHEARQWARTVTTSDDFEVFLSPQDAEGLEGCSILGMPVRKSIGVAQGGAIIFDRQRGRYVRNGEQPTETP